MPNGMGTTFNNALNTIANGFRIGAANVVIGSNVGVQVKYPINTGITFSAGGALNPRISLSGGLNVPSVRPALSIGISGRF
jgi:hypothetical protein